VNANATLYAKWESTATYIVTFNTNGGSGAPPASQTANAGSGVTLPSGSGLSKIGYTFGGWNTNADGTGTNYIAGSLYTVNANTTLYAKWVSPFYTVTFDANGGSGGLPSPMQVQVGGSITLPGGSGLSKSGFTFGGWNTNAAGTGTNYIVGSLYTVNANVTLYAKWSTVAPPPPTNSVVGAWICDQDSTYIIVFNSNLTGTWNDYGGAEPFTYTYSGNTITVTKASGTQTATMSGNTIYWDYGMTFTKQG
jgi:uncharacterized repeat protein (TIGR02543 family)